MARHMLGNSGTNRLEVDSVPFTTLRPFTVFYWINFTPNGGSSFQRMLSFSSSLSNQTGMFASRNSTKLYAGVAYTDPSAPAISANSFVEGEWSSVFFTWGNEGQTANAVLNGEWNNRGTMTVEAAASDFTKMAIGSLGTFYSNNDYYISDLTYWDGQLGESDATQLAAGKHPILHRRDILHSYFPLDGEDGTQSARNLINANSFDVVGSLAAAPSPVLSLGSPQIISSVAGLPPEPASNPFAMLV